MASPDDQLGGWTRVVAITLPVLLAFAVLVLGGSFAYYAPARLAALGVAAVVLGAYWVAAWRRPAWRPRSHLATAFILAFLAMAISTVLSRNVRISSEFLAYAVLLGALYLVLRELLVRDALRRRLEFGVVVVALVIPIAYAAVVVRDWIEWWGLVGELILPPLRPAIEGLTYANPSGVMAASVLATTAAIAATGTDSRRTRILAGVLIALTFVASVMSASRTGFLALGLAIVVVVGLAILRLGWRRLLESRRIRLGLGIGAVGVVVAVGLFWPAISTRLNLDGADLRGGIYLVSVREFALAPLTGVGPGMWPVLRQSLVEHPETDVPIPHGHDVFLETAAELGIVGVAAGIVLVLVILRLVRWAFRAGDPLTRRWAWAATFGGVYFAGHQVLDFWMNSPGIMLLAVFPIAWLDARKPPAERPSRIGRPTWLVAGAVLAIAVAWPVSRDLIALDYEAGVRAADRGDWPAARAPLQRAVEQDPDLPPYQFAHGLALAQTGELERARAPIRRYADETDDPMAWLALAAIEQRLGNPGVEELLDRALRLGRQQAIVGVGAGQILDSIDPSAAAVAYGYAIAIEPSLAEDDWMRDRLGDRFHVAIDIAMKEIDSDRRWEVALHGGNPDAAAELAERFAVNPEMATAAIVAWGIDVVTDNRLELLISRDPYDLPSLGWAARTAQRRGEWIDAARYRRWAELVASRGSLGGYVSKIERVAQSAGELSFRTIYQGTYSYRRAFPWSQVVTGLAVPVRT